MNKKEKKKSSLKSALLILLLIAVLMIASTYAWFTANKTVTVSNINVNVAASKGLQISTNCVDWKTIISNDDITKNAYSGNTNLIPESTANIVPVSTDGTVASGLLKMFDGDVEANTSGDLELTATSATDNSGHYVVFDLFVKLDSSKDSETIYLTSNSDVTKASTSATDGLKDAARIAFIKEGNIALTATATSATTLLTTETSSIIWEPNYDYHEQVGVDSYSNTYKLSGLTLTKGAGNKQVPYKGVSAATTTAVKLSEIKNATTGFKDVTPTIKTASGNSATDVSPFSLDKGITKLRVYYWVEGQDVDCENAASGGSIDLNFGFTLKD